MAPMAQPSLTRAALLEAQPSLSMTRIVTYGLALHAVNSQAKRARADRACAGAIMALAEQRGHCIRYFGQKKTCKATRKG
eukprot:5596860-Amphidinium_carterae.1